MIQPILTLTLTPKPILTKSNLNNNVPTMLVHEESEDAFSSEAWVDVAK
jgi:hypothetical protein